MNELKRKLRDAKVKLYLKRAKAVRHKCDWRDGKCAGMRIYGTWEMYKHGCCSECKQNNGYYSDYDDQITTEERNQIETLKCSDGSFRTGCGCNIPDDLRSLICLDYFCRSAGLTKEDDMLTTYCDVELVESVDVGDLYITNKDDQIKFMYIATIKIDRPVYKVLLT